MCDVEFTHHHHHHHHKSKTRTACLNIFEEVEVFYFH